jgi:hypothetical protein
MDVERTERFLHLTLVAQPCALPSCGYTEIKMMVDLRLPVLQVFGLGLLMEM